MGNLNERLLTNLKNTFTYEFWIQPDNVQQIDQQSQEIPAKTGGKNYIIGPSQGKFSDEAGVSVSAGINGVTVYEHSNNQIYAVLVYETIITGPIHIAIVYDDKIPYLLINGEYVKKGERSSKRNVYPSGIIGDHPGLFFNGTIKEIRVWNYGRTKQQIKSALNQQLIGTEEGLYAIWPAPSPDKQATATVKKVNLNNESKPRQARKAENENIEVSIIIPSYNKYPLNLFSLYSLEYQTFDPSKMEVIFIDDASTDGTAQNLKNYQPPFHFRYIRSQYNLGRSKIRNLGIRSARGNILIFLDAEMITEPDFVRNHMKYHQENDHVIATGVMHSQAIYTCVFPEFGAKILNRISKLSSVPIPSKVNAPYPLIDKKNIADGSYKNLIFKTFPWFKDISTNFQADLRGFQFPWMAFLTGNVSISKQFIQQAGGFDEKFVNYGYEDWELGYRLAKMGAKFRIASDLGTYHQEHPIGEDKWKEAIGNYGLFTLKHYGLETLILGLELSMQVDLLEMNKLLSECWLLADTYPNDFEDFQDRFMAILETIVLFLNVDIRHFNLLGATGFGTKEINELEADLNRLKKIGRFPHLTGLLDKLMNSKAGNYSVGGGK
jgi:GT2 family glycosyltransferase